MQRNTIRENIEIFIVTKIRFYAHADVTSREVHYASYARLTAFKLA